MQGISDPNEASTEARECRRFFDHVRDLLLQAYPWRFAGKLAPMAENVDNIRSEYWAHSYKRPTDCLKVRSVSPTRKIPSLPFNESEPYGVPYDYEADAIFCDISPAYLHYTYQCTDTSRFTATFIEALSWHLAARLAMPLTKDQKLRADCLRMATVMEIAAQTSDANEVRESSDHESEFVGARG